MVVHDSYMIRIPTNRTADMKHKFRYIEEQRSYHVADIFSLLIVTCVQCVHHMVLSTIACIEIVRAHGVTFHSDSEQFGFEAGLHAWQFLCQYLIQTFFQYLTITEALHCLIFFSVVNPNIHDTRITLSFAHCISYLTATFGMLNPEI